MFKLIKSIFSKNITSAETKKSIAVSYTCPPSISNKLPWMEYDTDNKCFLLDDGKSVAAVFELADVASEARPDSFLEQLQKGLQGLFQDVFPQYFDNESPWIIQFYVQDELSLKSSAQAFQDYIKPAAQNSRFSNEYFKLISDHFSLLSQSQGLFVDTKVSGLPFCGRQRKIRAVIYRKLNNSSKLRRGRNAVDDLNTIAQSFTAKLEGCGVKVIRYTGKEFYEWMVRWFNPAPQAFNHDPNELLQASPYPGDAEMLFGYDFSEKLFFGVPESDQEKGFICYDLINT